MFRKNLYVMQDVVSGQFGEIFESENDDTLRRCFSLVYSSSDDPVRCAAFRDLRVYCVGSVVADYDGVPVVTGCDRRVALLGAEIVGDLDA